MAARRSVNDQRDSDTLELARFQKEIDYFALHEQELLGRYPDQWVAIYGEQVVGAHAQPERLLKQLQQNGIPIEKAVIRRMSQQDEMLILAG